MYYKKNNNDGAIVFGGCLVTLLMIVFSIAITAGTIAACVWAIVWVLQAMGVM